MVHGSRPWVDLTRCSLNYSECLSSPPFDCGKLVYSLANQNPDSSVGSAWARCPQRRGFDPPLGTFSGSGDFSLGVNMGSNSIPPMRV